MLAVSRPTQHGQSKALYLANGGQLSCAVKPVLVKPLNLCAAPCLPWQKLLEDLIRIDHLTISHQCHIRLSSQPLTADAYSSQQITAFALLQELQALLYLPLFLQSTLLRVCRGPALE